VTQPLVVLVHSSSVGPSTWAPVAHHLRRRGFYVEVPSMLGFVSAGPPFVNAYLEAAERSLTSVAADRPLILAGHSNAGLFLPAIAASLAPRHVSLLFADASIPDPEGSDAPVAPVEYLGELRAMAVDGVLPRWSEWWPAEDLSALYPDLETRALIGAEEPNLPLAFYEELVPVPPSWAERPCAYLLFSAGYEGEARRARDYGWPLREVRGEHLHMLVDPHGVAGAIEELAVELAVPATAEET
jgi:hypothetical protein